MPVKAISIRAVQVMVDLIRDVLEKVMDEAATCADSNGRVIIGSGHIKQVPSLLYRSASTHFART